MYPCLTPGNRGRDRSFRVAGESYRREKSLLGFDTILDNPAPKVFIGICLFFNSQLFRVLSLFRDSFRNISTFSFTQIALQNDGAIKLQVYAWFKSGSITKKIFDYLLILTISVCDNGEMCNCSIFIFKKKWDKCVKTEQYCVPDWHFYIIILSCNGITK